MALQAIAPVGDLRSKLIDRFERIRMKNPAYSVRAYARDLKIHASTLSRILAGKRRLTDLQASKLLSRLSLGAEDGVIPVEPTYQTLSLQEHLMLSRWYVAAIQELTHTKGFRSDPEWIAQRLGLDLAEVTDLIERLVTIGFLRRDVKGKLLDGVEHWYTDMYENHPDAKRINVQKHQDLCRRSVQAYERLTEEWYSFTRMTFSGDPDQMDKARELIARFRRDIDAIFQANTRDRSEVFLLQVSLFPLTIPVEKPARKKQSA